MWRRQFRVLYRDFLFRIVDRGELSTHATGDASRLLLQVVALLACLGACFTIPVLSLDPGLPASVRLMFAWSVEHFLIATTMLVVGIIVVMNWDSMFPSQRDVLVLGPLPIRAHTMLLANVAAVATTLGLAVIALHVIAGLVWPAALNAFGRGRPVHALPLTYDPAMSPVATAELKGVLDKDLAPAIRKGMLAPSIGGGLVIGVYDRGVRHVWTYGHAAPTSVFQIGSVTKPFTGLLLAQMAEEGIVRLDEPVRAFMPGARLPRQARHEITLLDLATHSSGLPSMPPTFRPANRANPYADFGVADIYAFLERRGLEKPPDASLSYSNLGYGLLGHVLSRRARTDYATLVRQRITEPLAMPDTVVELSSEQRSRLMQGHNDDRQPIPPWDVGALAGAGALYSTAPDLLTWLEAYLHPERLPAGTLSVALAASPQVRVRAGASGGIGLAWMVRPDSGVFEHGGATLAFTADAFFIPKEDIAVVVLSNVGPGTVTSADVLGEYLRARLSGKPAVSLAELTIPATGGARSWIRLLTAYWFTMIAAAVFMAGFAMSVQGLAAALLPRRHFLRVSALLQLGMFCLVIGTFLLQPMVIRPGVMLEAQHWSLLGASPSYWFLGLFQALAGSPALAPLAARAWMGLGLAAAATVLAYALSYARTIRQVAEQPDVIQAASRRRWLPAFGTGFETAVVQFSVRTLFRSARPRRILAFYWGLGFALITIVLKTPRGQQLAEGSIGSAWHATAVPLLFASIVIMAFAVLGARLAFAMPRDLQANWIFRVVPGRSGSENMTARRRAFIVVSVAPVWTAWVVVLLWRWPWQPAIGHLVALAVLGLTLVEVALIGTQRIPFACSYLPGRTHLHVTLPIGALFLVLTFRASTFVRDALLDPSRFATMLAVLSLAWVAVRWRNACAASDGGAQPQFDDEPADQTVTLDVWDTRFRSGVMAAIPNSGRRDA